MSQLKYVLIGPRGGRGKPNWDNVLKSASFFFDGVPKRNNIIVNDDVGHPSPLPQNRVSKTINLALRGRGQLLPGQHQLHPWWGDLARGGGILQEQQRLQDHPRQVLVALRWVDNQECPWNDMQQLLKHLVLFRQGVSLSHQMRVLELQTPSEVGYTHLY